MGAYEKVRREEEDSEKEKVGQGKGTEEKENKGKECSYHLTDHAGQYINQIFYPVLILLSF